MGVISIERTRSLCTRVPHSLLYTVRSVGWIGAFWGALHGQRRSQSRPSGDDSIYQPSAL